MDVYDVATEAFCLALDAELVRRQLCLNINAVAEIPRFLARVAVENVLPAVRDGRSSSVVALRANCAAIVAISEVEKLVKEHTS